MFYGLICWHNALCDCGPAMCGAHLLYIGRSLKLRTLPFIYTCLGPASALDFSAMKT
jgi:hypothetical protein